MKTRNLEAEYFRLSMGSALPTLAQVHAFDTEAVIGSRPPVEKVSLEKYLIKEKINQSEKTKEYTKTGVDESGLVAYVYDDMGRLSDSVIARAEAMKQGVMATGKININENNLNFSIDLGVPNDNFVTANWSDPEHNILGDIAAWKKIAKDQGQTITKAADF